MTREEIISRSFKEYPKTIRKVSRETCIPSREIRRIIRRMEQEGRIWRLYRRICPLSEFMLFRWTTNREIAFGYRILEELIGKKITSDEQIEIMKRIRADYGE